MTCGDRETVLSFDENEAVSLSGPLLALNVTEAPKFHFVLKFDV